MLTSLFGDLGPRDGKNKPRDFDDTQPDSQGGFAATAIMESVATEVNERGQIIDRHVSDLVVTGSPAQAIREHFAATRPDLETALPKYAPEDDDVSDDRVRSAFSHGSLPRATRVCRRGARGDPRGT